MLNTNIQQRIREQSQENRVIVAFADSTYKRIALNWVLHMQQLSLNNYIVIAFDKETEDFLHDNQVNTVLIQRQIPPQRFKKIFRERFAILRDILEMGLHVVHSDLDAIWLQNPLIYIDFCDDIVASTGKFPSNVYEEWGFTFCMGWMYFKPSSDVLEIFDTILQKEADFNDQQEFNAYFFERRQELHKQKTDQQSTILDYGSLQIRVLSQFLISRRRNKPGALVHHPVSARKSDREIFLQSLGLWLVE